VHGQVSFAGQGAQRKAQRIRGMILDISDTRRMEQRLSHSERLEAVGRLASAIAHDSNNLLTVVLSNLELALARTHDAEARRMIATAVNAAEVNAGFNRRLLSLSCTRSDRADVVRIGAHLDAMQPLLRHAVGDRIELGIEAGDGLWPVRADPGDLDSALLNLALNARDAMPDGGRLSVTARNASLDAGDAARLGAPAREGAFVCIEIRDSGIGMSDEVAAQAMEPFFTTKPKGRGTGLGLTSTGSFVSRLEGFMTIDSTPGKGTRVALFLPRATGAAEGEADPAATRAEPAHGQGEVVLLVEDNRDVREAGLKRLEVLGYVAIEARDATEALETLARGEPVDLVFSDVSMPGPDSGLSLVRRVRRDFPGLAVLLTTADGTQILHKDSDAALAMVEILPKPHTISDLARALRRALDRRDPSRDRPRP
jgi:signal transduction histidine kinase/ActR/RegA family two-component response regulator